MNDGFGIAAFMLAVGLAIAAAQCSKPATTIEVCYVACKPPNSAAAADCIRACNEREELAVEEGSND